MSAAITTTLQCTVVTRGMKKRQCATPGPQGTGIEFSKGLKLNNTSAKLGKSNQKDFSRPSREDIKYVEFLDANDSPIKRAGKFLLGPIQGTCPVNCIQHFLARKDGTDEFYILKILTIKDVGEEETRDDVQGKTLFQTEHSLLSLLKYEKGVVHEHGMFREIVQQKVVDEKGKVTTKDVRRLCLIMDCFVAHDFSPKYNHITNMQCYVIKEKKLPESEAIRIFCEVMETVERLHKLNIVHRDIKLGNIILNKVTRQVTLANFCLGKHVTGDSDLLTDQRGSPAYISPDVITGKPYLAKPSDMWAVGVVLYTMIFGQFPFYDQHPTELFRKIKLGHFQIPTDVIVSTQAVELIQSLLVLDPKKRLTASQALEKARSIIAAEQSLMSDTDLQVVPVCHRGNERPMKRTYSEPSSPDSVDDIKSVSAKCEESTDIEELEPLRKMVKLGIASKQLEGLISQHTLNHHQLHRIQAMLLARKIMGAVTNQLLSNSSNGSILIESLTTTDTDTDTDTACVPEWNGGTANAMNPATDAVGLETN